MDIDGKDLFVHYDDMKKAGVTKEQLRNVRFGYQIRFTFSKMMYIGKYDRSSKAIDIQLL
jgi:hypothetical protein